MAMDDVGRLGDRLDHASLVIGEMNRHQRASAWVVRDETRQPCIQPDDVDQAVCIDRDRLDCANRETMPVAYAGMFGRTMQEKRCGRPHAVAPAIAIHQAGREHRDIRFGAAAGEDDVRGLGADEPGNLLARPLHGGPRGASLTMDGGRIAGHRQRMRDRFHHLRPHRGRGIMVEIGASRRHDPACSILVIAGH